MNRRIALFGESERGQAGMAYYCDSLPQLADTFGNPPEESNGLHCAVQALLFNFGLIYFPVEEEGFSHDDYFQGIETLQEKELIKEVGAFCLPGVGDRNLLNAITQLCERHTSILITNQSDLYDYLTA